MRTGTLITTTLISDRAALAAARDAMPGTVAAVLTMGALHDGHASLIRLARQRADHVLVSVFVNPLQFGESEDFQRYPRNLEADVALAEAAGADLVFAPDRAEIWPTPPRVTVDAGPVAQLYEGAIRPGHFNGVCTVVLALFHLLRPDVSVFGDKDAQQLAVIRSMVRDLAVPVEVVGAPIVREADGLAMSSRNRFLTAPERAAARVLSRALRAGADMAGAGRRAALQAAGAVLATEPSVHTDYLEIVTPEFDIADGADGRIIVAARVGAVHLLDNMTVALKGS